MKQNCHDSISVFDRRITEKGYHKSINVQVVLVAIPFFMFFLLFYGLRGSHLQALIYFALLINAVVTLLLVFRAKDTQHLLHIKQTGATIAFGLLAGSIVGGLLSDDIYIMLPWICFYPVTVMLFFGKRIGIISALIFCVVTAVIIANIDFPAWNDANLQMFKLSSVLALALMLFIGMISERTRLRMRNGLLEARNKYKTAEARQRRTNEELKSEIEMRMHSEEALVQSETRYRALFEESAVSLLEANYAKVKSYLDALPMEAAEDFEAYFKENPGELKKCIGSIRVTAVNRAALKLYGAKNMPEMLKHILDVLPSDLLSYMAPRLASLYMTGQHEAQITVQTISGRKLHLLEGSTIPVGYENSWEKVFISAYDVSERTVMEEEKKQVERQIQHTRQVQAIASLAGGIAHQFNNALAVIYGNIDLLELEIKRSEKNQGFLHSLRASSEHMRCLTEQLLAYARGGKYQPRDFSLSELIRDVLKNNKIARGSSYKVKVGIEDDVILAESDITQIRIVLEAVLANAAEAMAGGGEISISARNLQVEDGSNGAGSVLVPGDYATITFEDHGIGMDEETCQRIFEPFFSTKFVGRGLGMAAAYGIVRNHDGIIEVESKPHKGTRVKIYLPSTKSLERIPMDDSSRQAA